MSKAGREKGVTPSVLEIHLLGPFHVAVDGRAAEERHFTRRKPKLLVKLLALQPHHQLHQERVMDLLWPESDLESATNSLHKAIHLARRALEPRLKSASDSHFIITQGQQVVLSAHAAKSWTGTTAQTKIWMTGSPNMKAVLRGGER